jgi:hypothetical protein
MERRTEQVDLVILMVILHEEPVTLHDMLAKIPSEHQVENPSGATENWRDDPRLEVGPNACLYHAWLI